MEYPNTLLVRRGESAWATVVQLRYSPRFRNNVRNVYKKYPKTDSLLILFHDKTKKTIEYRFFLNKDLMDPTDEGDLNMFGSFLIDEMQADHEYPSWLLTQYKFLLGLLNP